MKIKTPTKFKPLLEPIDAVRVCEKNMRTGHSVAAIIASLREFGWHAPIVARKNGEVLIGNGRLKAALELELEKVPVLRVSDGDAKAARRMFADNRTSELSVWDVDVMADYGDALSDLDAAYLLEDVYQFREPEDELDDDPTTGDGDGEAELLREKWGVETGQIWTLSDHRLLCGDCTKREDVEKVMRGEKAQCVFTDPPYGVDYDGGTKTREKLKGDDSTDLYLPACKMSREFSDDEAPLYLWHAVIKGKSAAAAAAAAAAKYEIRNEIIWNKNIAQFGNLSAQYKQKHEPCFYCFKSGQSPRWYGPTNEVTVWDIDRSSVNEFHPTQKPPELAVRALRNSTKKGDVVADWFSGSASTLIACEQLDRKCRAIEISPAYVAVALERWHKATGKDPVLDS